MRLRTGSCPQPWGEATHSGTRELRCALGPRSRPDRLLGDARAPSGRCAWPASLQPCRADFVEWGGSIFLVCFNNIIIGSIFRFPVTGSCLPGSMCTLFFSVSIYSRGHFSFLRLWLRRDRPPQPPPVVSFASEERPNWPSSQLAPQRDQGLLVGRSRPTLGAAAG